MSPHTRRILLALAGLLAAAACTGVDDLEQEDLTVATVAITSEGGRTTLAVNETLRLTAVAKNAAGRELPVTFTWTSKDAAKASVANDGLVTGKASGDLQIEAKVDDKVGTIALKVQGAVHVGAATASETWRASDNPHRVLDGSFWMAGVGSPSLTIEAGVEVRFETGTHLSIGDGSEGGRLVVQGTEAAPVRFTSNAQVPAAGDWAGLVFHPATTADVSWLEIEYGGASAGTGHHGVVQVLGENTKPVLKHVTVRDGAHYGVGLSNGGAFGAGSTHLTLENNAKHGIFFNEPNGVHTIPANTVLNGNRPDAILVAGGTVSTTQTWANHGAPYVITHTFIDVEGTGTPVLTLQKGTTLRFGPDTGFRVGNYEAGELKAIGTGDEPVTFTSDAGEKAPGQWGGLVFGTESSAASRLEWAVVEYAGGGAGTGYADAAITVLGDKGAFIKNTTVRHSGGFGIVRGDPQNDGFTTDFTAGVGNTFEENADGAQSVFDD